jgi:dienelactone hydrolase
LAEASKRRVDVLVEVVEPKPSADVAADAPLGSGPYPAVMQTVAALPDHTLYRPRELPAAGSPALPVLLWANGACLNVGNRFRWFLSEVASHGFLVIALGRVGPAEVESNPASTYRGEPAADSPAAKEAEGPRPAAWRPGQASTTPGQLLMGLDWAQQAQHEAGGPWQGRIDSSRVAVMGQSCGGLQALAVAGDPRIRTVGVWNSGGLTDEGMAARIAGAPVTKEQITALRVPALYVTGDMGDVAFPNADDDFQRIDQAPVFRAWREQTGHSGTYRDRDGVRGGGAFAPVAVDWLLWQLKGDRQAARRFVGPDCGLCTQPDWHVQKKGME